MTSSWNHKEIYNKNETLLIGSSPTPSYLTRDHINLSRLLNYFQSCWMVRSSLCYILYKIKCFILGLTYNIIHGFIVMPWNDLYFVQSTLLLHFEWFVVLVDELHCLGEDIIWGRWDFGWIMYQSFRIHDGAFTKFWIAGHVLEGKNKIFLKYILHNN